MKITQDINDFKYQCTPLTLKKYLICIVVLIWDSYIKSPKFISYSNRYLYLKIQKESLTKSLFPGYLLILYIKKIISEKKNP